MVNDIRAVAAQEHWNQFESAWTALLSYRYLGKLSPDLDADVDVDVDQETMPIRHDMRNPVGGIMAAPLCIASPEPYWLDSQCVPAPVTMSYDILDSARDVRRVVVHRDVIHLGRTMGFSRSRVVDADDPRRVIAVSCGTGVSLGDVPDGYRKVPNPPVPVEDSPSLPPLHHVFGARRGDDGQWRLPEVTPELASPHSALHLGPICIVLETAAMEAAAGHADTDALQIDSWTIMFIRPGVAGPFRAQAEVVSGRSERVAVNLTLRDEGRDDRIVSSAKAVFRRV